MRLRSRWEWLGVLFGLLVGFDQLLVGMPVVAIGVFVGVAACVTVRAELVVPPGKAAGYASARARLGVAQSLLLMAAAVLSVAGLFVDQVEHWYRSAPGDVAMVALAALEVLLLAEVTRRSDAASRWLVGSRAERVVAAELAPLESEGWRVVHDWPLRRGNVDHVVFGPSGVFAVETKSGRISRADKSQAAGAAAQVQRLLGGGWVQAVICSGAVGAPEKRDVVWFVPRAELRAWLTAQHGRPLDVEAAASRLTLVADR